ncbi:beta-mannosidase [Spirochaetia bacterium]|nr:beta-mannosidase [Spirochaetia bacterium]
MKTITTIDSKWKLRRLDPVDKLDISRVDDLLKDGPGPRDRVFAIPKMPAQVYEILIAEKVIENPNIHGDSSACQWVAESDWLYVNDFTYTPEKKTAYFDFQGLDTWADIYLNGELIAEHEDAYLPRRTDVTGKLLEKNRLVIHFHSPRKKYDAVVLSDYVKDAQGKIKPGARTRMFGTTLGEYLGPKPNLLRVGIYGVVRIVALDPAEIANLHTPYVLSKALDTVSLDINVTVKGKAGIAGHALVKAALLNPKGEVAASGEFPLDPQKYCAAGNFVINNPEVWWPRTHGKSPLYTLTAELYIDKIPADKITRKIGFRNIEQLGDFDFTINGLPLKIYGSNLAPADTLTNVYNPERMNALLDLAELAHHNCLRVWGENERLDDDFYDECDARGFLIWQDFFTTYSMYDVNPHLFDLLRQEAEDTVLRLRDHACIWLWCGGNENIMSGQFEYPGEEMMGLAIFDEIFPAVCSRLDPGRYYHRSSPDGGAYANDPLGGDTHGYTHIWYVPGSYYPVFLSENNRVSPPAKRTMQRMMKKEDLWPAGYDGLQHKNDELPWPEQWNKYNSNQGYWKLGEIENYYDATDLDAMLYRIGWAHGDYLRRRVERYRRGCPREDNTTERITKGHILWLLNGSSNHIFFNVIDYFLEPNIAYYSIKRAYEPVLLSFDVGNFIKLWMVNDSVKPLSGRVFIRLFSPQKNCVVNDFEIPFEIAPDESKFLTDCNRFGQFKSNNILHAYAVTSDGKRVAESFDYADIERHMRFPRDGKISLTVDKGELLLQSSRYERSVELLGNADGDEFGWLFDDNYFDLLPGQIKRVKVLGRHDRGTISAKGYYSDTVTGVEFVRPSSCCGAK